MESFILNAVGDFDGLGKLQNDKAAADQMETLGRIESNQEQRAIGMLKGYREW